MNADEAEMAGEVSRILDILPQRLALSTRWNGTLHLVPDADFQGKKPFHCSIQIHARLVADPLR